GGGGGETRPRGGGARGGGWRGGGPGARPVSRGSRRSSRCKSCWGGSTLLRAAASSIANGKPSSRAQISATARVLASVTWKSGRASSARSMKRVTAAYCVSRSTTPCSGSTPAEGEGDGGITADGGAARSGKARG